MADADLNLWEFIIAIVTYQAIVGLALYLIISAAWTVIGVLIGRRRKRHGRK